VAIKARKINIILIRCDSIILKGMNILQGIF